MRTVEDTVRDHDPLAMARLRRIYGKRRILTDDGGLLSAEKSLIVCTLRPFRCQFAATVNNEVVKSAADLSPISVLNFIRYSHLERGGHVYNPRGGPKMEILGKGKKVNLVCTDALWCSGCQDSVSYTNDAAVEAVIVWSPTRYENRFSVS